MEKLIIDTDPGIDDALAILMALHAESLSVEALTTVFGNVSVDQASRNARYLLELANRADIPIYRGASEPLIKPHGGYPDFVHGGDGFGNLGLELPDFSCGGENAAAKIVEMVNQQPGELTLVPLGPLTNIAMALALDPSIAGKVNKVIVMGGAVTTRGNVTPVAEANILNDPHAAQRVFSADWPVVLIGLDVTHQLDMHELHMQRIRESSPRCGDFLYRATRYYTDFYRTVRPISGFCPHDPTTIAYLLRPDLFTEWQGQIEVITDGPAQGQTIYSAPGMPYPDPVWTQRSNVSACVDLEAERVLTLITDTLCQAP